MSATRRDALRRAEAAFAEGDHATARRIAEGHVAEHGPDDAFQALLDDVMLMEESRAAPEDSPYPLAAAGWTPEQYSPAFTPPDPAKEAARTPRGEDAERDADETSSRGSRRAPDDDAGA